MSNEYELDYCYKCHAMLQGPTCHFCEYDEIQVFCKRDEEHKQLEELKQKNEQLYQLLDKVMVEVDYFINCLSLCPDWTTQPGHNLYIPKFIQDNLVKYSWEWSEIELEKESK